MTKNHLFLTGGTSASNKLLAIMVNQKPFMMTALAFCAILDSMMQNFWNLFRAAWSLRMSLAERKCVWSVHNSQLSCVYSCTGRLFSRTALLFKQSTFEEKNDRVRAFYRNGRFEYVGSGNLRLNKRRCNKYYFIQTWVKREWRLVPESGRRWQQLPWWARQVKGWRLMPERRW